MKELCLGSALWGWSVERKDCFLLLDRFYDLGFRYIDTAFNYPINNDPLSLSLSRNILSEWASANQVNDLKVIYKIGSISNKKSKENNLSNKFLISQVEDFLEKNKSKNLECAMIHWDNESAPYEENHFEEFVAYLNANGVKLGLSGVDPRVYENLKLKNQEILIEGKLNILQNDIEKYCKYFDNKKMFAYGISAGGLKMQESDYRLDSYVSIARDKNYHQDLMNSENKKKISRYIEQKPFCKNMYHIGITLCEELPYLDGYIVAPRNKEQLEEIISFRNLYKELKDEEKY